MLLILFGPPAVGKMTVGRALANAGRFRLFHNHMTIEPLIETFGYGTPAFNTLNSEFRRRVLEEAAAHDIDLVFTLVWALDSEEDRDVIDSYVQIFDGRAAFVELRADLDTRLARNRTEGRLLHKASKRDLDWSDSHVRDLESQWAMTSTNGTHAAGELLSRHPHLVLDVTAMEPVESAEQIVTWLATNGADLELAAESGTTAPTTRGLTLLPTVEGHVITTAVVADGLADDEG